MRIIEVIESKHWVNRKTGQTASLYGAKPWTGNGDKSDWVLESRGWTWRLDNGTVGLGRQPVKTYQEALDIMVTINNALDK